MTAIDQGTYLLRLGDRGPCEPTAGTLTRLHRAHMRTVPFENLDICFGVPIRLELPALYDKIVARRRGGFCYELNALFGWLLGTLGFRLELLSARVYDGGRPGREFDHLLLLVDLGDRWIADVGFGDSFVEPLPLDGGPVHQDGSDYRLVTEGPDRILELGPGDNIGALLLFVAHGAHRAWACDKFYSEHDKERHPRDAGCPASRQRVPRTIPNGRGERAPSSSRSRPHETSCGQTVSHPW